MPQRIIPISLRMPLKLGRVNCYLVKIADGFILVDTGGTNARREFEAALNEAGCQPGDLKLIVLTHGDFDHTGNAAYLRRKHGTQIAMHAEDAGMAERGDMFWNRKKGSPLFRIAATLLFRFGTENRFTADIWLQDSADLSAYGFAAHVLSLPGHSRGSLGVLTASGDLFSGDLFDNTHNPVLNAIMDDLEAAHSSVARLSQLTIHTVYPGHGKPFSMEDYAFTNKK